MAIREIDAAEHRVLVNAYALTGGAGFAEALVRAKERGVEVEVIADRGVPCERHSGVPMLVEAAIPVWIDQRVRLAHAKVMVIDGAVTLVGSYNFTVQASLNSEDLNVIRSAAVAAQYEQHWRRRRDVSVPYGTRGDWCAVGSEIVR
jgi:phosphatidylserine/phosphatidylglycerophosphate/cardiolipin synthase-like enzyme